jgi:hypothetical protein
MLILVRGGEWMCARQEHSRQDGSASD